jgi:hypothetical protein
VSGVAGAKRKRRRTGAETGPPHQKHALRHRLTWFNSPFGLRVAQPRRGRRVKRVRRSWSEAEAKTDWGRNWATAPETCSSSSIDVVQFALRATRGAATRGRKAKRVRRSWSEAEAKPDWSRNWATAPVIPTSVSTRALSSGNTIFTGRDIKRPVDPESQNWTAQRTECLSRAGFRDHYQH